MLVKLHVAVWLKKSDSKSKYTGGWNPFTVVPKVQRAVVLEHWQLLKSTCSLDFSLFFNRAARNSSPHLSWSSKNSLTPHTGEHWKCYHLSAVLKWITAVLLYCCSKNLTIRCFTVHWQFIFKPIPCTMPCSKIAWVALTYHYQHLTTWTLTLAAFKTSSKLLLMVVIFKARRALIQILILCIWTLPQTHLTFFSPRNYDDYT